jgi:perosamine synthetase
LPSIELSPAVTLGVPAIGDEEVAAVSRVLHSGHLAQGPEVAAFEVELAQASGLAYGVAMNSGTAAIHAALAALGVGPGDRVLTTPFTFAASATPILMLGARPCFRDIDPRTFNLDVAMLAAESQAGIKAAVVVDLFGLPVDPSSVAALRAQGVRVVEDACQSIGASRGGVPAGKAANATALSFYATKNLTTGEGGMLLSDDAAVAGAARRFRHHGQADRYEYLELGYNFRMTDMSAAIGRVQLARLAGFNAARRANADFYARELAEVDGLTLPYVPLRAHHVYHQYCVLIDPEQTPNGRDRDAVRAALAEEGVESGVYYPKPLHLQPLFAKLGYARGDFPLAERTARQILALPVHPSLEEAASAHVVRALRRALGAPAW